MNKQTIITALLTIITTTSIVAQNLIKSATSPISFSKKDFADTIKIKVIDGAVIVPVEIKAGNNLRSRSLLAYCKEYEPRKAIRCSLHTYHEDDPITELPLYAMANIEKVIK